VEPRGFEPLTSAVQSLYDSLLEDSGVFKIPANLRIFSTIVFSGFWDIRLGCCTVAALILKRRSLVYLLGMASESRYQALLALIGFLALFQTVGVHISWQSEVLVTWQGGSLTSKGLFSEATPVL